MAKRGRKPNPDKQTGYFHEREEQAVVDYLNTDSADEKNRLYVTILMPAFTKLVESIIRRYRLYVPEEEYDDTFTDALTFIFTKMDKFNPKSGTKAYSYFGTICRHYLSGRILAYQKNLKRTQSYDVIVPDLVDDIRYSDYEDRSTKIAKDSMSLIINKIGVMIENPSQFNLNDNEVKLGTSLKMLLENWDYVLSTDGSKKLNKNAILLYLRDSTGFDTKGIRDNLKKYKNEFYEIKNKLISE